MLDRKRIRVLLSKSWPFVLLTLLMTVLMPHSGEFEYNYVKGGRWDYETLVPQFNFPILKSQKQLSEDNARARETYVPYYNFDESVILRLAEAFPDIDRIADPSLAYAFAGTLDSLYERGVLDDDFLKYEDPGCASSEVVCIQRGKEVITLPRKELFTRSEAVSALMSVFYRYRPSSAADSISALPDLNGIVAPNLAFDKTTTENVHREAVNSVANTDGVFQAGDVLVRKGDIITEETARLLDSYKEEFTRTMSYADGGFSFIMGSVMISAIFVLLLLSMLSVCGDMLSNRNECLFVLVLYCLMFFLMGLMSSRPARYGLLVPYAVFALYLSAFFGKKRALPLYVVFLIPILVLGRNAVMLFFLNLCTGATAVTAFSRFNKGWKQFLTSLLVFLSTLVVYVAYKLFTGSMDSLSYTVILYLLLNSLFLIAAYPLVYLFEKLFNLVSISRLVDLADTNNSLLLELSSKAPGTFQHSLAVMNMAEAAGRSIDANVPLLRVAALYHDVGKMNNPMCFIENQVEGVKYHEALTPLESAQDIIRHVDDGLTLARKASLPSVVTDFISTHHGTTTASYFLTKYLNDGGDPSREAEFTYPGPRPSTREHAILMICDTLEAASRTVKDFSPKAVSDFVDRVIESKMSQLENTDITLKELHSARACLINYIIQNHHGRIAYPKRNKN